MWWVSTVDRLPPRPSLCLSVHPSLLRPSLRTSLPATPPPPSRPSPFPFPPIVPFSLADSLISSSQPCLHHLSPSPLSPLCLLDPSHHTLPTIFTTFLPPSPPPPPPPSPQVFSNRPIVVEDVDGSRMHPEEAVGRAFDSLKAKLSSGPPEIILWILDVRKTSRLYGTETQTGELKAATCLSSFDSPNKLWACSVLVYPTLSSSG